MANSVIVSHRGKCAASNKNNMYDLNSHNKVIMWIPLWATATKTVYCKIKKKILIVGFKKIAVICTFILTEYLLQNTTQRSSESGPPNSALDTLIRVMAFNHQYWCQFRVKNKIPNLKVISEWSYQNDRPFDKILNASTLLSITNECSSFFKTYF